MKNNSFNTKDIRSVCEKKLDIEFRTKGKEYNGWVRLNGKKMVRITVPKGRKNVPRGTYKSMADQLLLSVSDFDSLLECPLTRSRYEQILKERRDG